MEKLEKCREEFTRSGYTFEGFREKRDPETGKLSEDGRTFTFRKYTERWVPKTSKSFTVGPDMSVGVRSFDYFRVLFRTSARTEIIGQITAHTTEARLESMIYRYFHPGHADVSVFDGPVVESRSRSTGKNGKRYDSVFHHVTIPSEIVSRCDYRVDDEAEIHIHNAHGEHYSYRYHLSFRSRTDGDPEDTGSLVVPLNPVRRLVYFQRGERTVFKNVTESEYRQHEKLIAEGKPVTIEYTYQPRATKEEKEKYGEKWKPAKVTIHPVVRRFISPGDIVTVSIDPQEFTENEYTDGNKKKRIPGRAGRFDLAKETLHVIALAKLTAQEDE